MTKDELFQLYKRFSALDTPFLYNVNNGTERRSGKRALLIYLTKPFQIEENDPLFLLHQNLRRCKHIAAILGEFGYIVDVADGRDLKIEYSNDYDLIISDKADLQNRDRHFREDAIKLFLATTDDHTTHNDNLLRRHNNLHQRRNCEIEVRRKYPAEVPYVTRSDAIIGVGNEYTMSSWKNVFKGPIYWFNNCGFKETRSPLDKKDFKTARRNFLFFASMSQTQKGLDLLLEIFPKHSDLHLYVCGPFEHEEDFCNCYYKELYETPNIHPVGWVTVNSPDFYDLIDNTAYVIHPTCSEGQPGSVVQCMYAGLIPLATKEAGIRTGDFGITFADDSLNELERVITEVSCLPESWHREHSSRTYNIARGEYSEEALIRRWRDILAEVLTTA